MIEDHVFVPTPFYPDLCDAFTDDIGTRRRCARPGREHSSCAVHAGHPKHAPVLQVNGRIRYLACSECSLWLGDLEALAVAPLPPSVPLKESVLRAAIIEALKVIRGAHGGTVHSVETILQRALDQTAGK